MKVKELMNCRSSLFECPKYSGKQTRVVTLREFLSDVAYDNRNKIRYARTLVDDIDKYKKYKEANLNACTISGVFNHKRLKNSKGIELNGVICIDIDHLKTHEVNIMKQRVLNEFDYTFLAARSLSGNGIYVLCHYDLNCVKQTNIADGFEAVWNGIRDDFMSHGITIDVSCKDVCRLRIVSIDERTLIKRDDTEIRAFDKPLKIHQSNDVDNDLSYDCNYHCNNELSKDGLIELTRVIGILIKNGYGQDGFDYYDDRFNDDKKYDYTRWRLDAWRLGSLSNKKYGYKLFTMISKHANGFTTQDDVDKMWNKYRTRQFDIKQQTNNIGYYFALYNRMSHNSHI